MNVYERAKDLKEELVAWRRRIHQDPEGGPDQPRTVEFVMETLKSFGLEPQKLGGGVVALIKGEKPGKTILLRADMDALFMDELSGLPFCSQNRGVNHACGHDMHTAMLLGAAKILSERREDIHGCVKLCFQPAEEIAAGAARMIAAGVMEDPKVDVAMGIHMVIAAQYPTGTVAVSPGVTLASTDLFKITAIGRGGHGARPEASIDPINMICHIHSLLQTINSREVSAKETVVLTVGEISGGHTANSIPDEAYIRGTIRTLKNENRELVRRRLVEISEKTAEALGGRAEVQFEAGMPPCVNEEKLTLEMKSYMREIFGEGRVDDMPTRLGSEDFARIAEMVPAVFIFLSGGSVAEGYTVGAHNPKVRFSEDALPVGSAAHAQCAIRWLEEHSN